jgi:hypothetical protein
MANPTLGELITLVRQKADMENDGNFISDSEITHLFNDSLALLWAFLNDGTNGSLFSKNSPVLLKIGPQAYQLPNDFYQLLDVALFTGGTYIRSTEADPQAYMQLTTLNNANIYSPQHILQYNHEQGRFELSFFPAPTTTANIAVRYVPQAQVLSVSTDALNLPSNWHMWAVLDSAIQCLIKEESDPSAQMAEREKREERIKDEIRSMGISQIKTIRKIRRFPFDRFALPPINFS